MLVGTGYCPCAVCGLFLTAFKCLDVSNKFIARIELLMLNKASFRDDSASQVLWMRINAFLAFTDRFFRIVILL